MNDPKYFDPLLHSIRTAGYSIEDAKLRNVFETARFNLYQAIERREAESAGQWLDALDTFFNVHRWENPVVETNLKMALKQVRDGLNEGLIEELTDATTEDND